MAGKHKWAHRGPKKHTKRGKEKKFAEKQKKHCQAANDAVAKRKAELEQYAN